MIDRLPLPEGVFSARYIDGMREIVQYVVNIDGFLVRWDIIGTDSRQYCCKKKKPEGGPALSIEEWCRGERINARRSLIELQSDGVETQTEIVR